MVNFCIFILFLFLENLFLPAIIGPSQSFITIIFVLALLIYGDGWRTLLYQVIPFALITEFFVGENFSHLVIPLGLTGIIYIMTNKFVDFSQGLKRSKKFWPDLILSVVTLIIFSYIYVGLFIFLNTPYRPSIGWYEFTISFKSSLLNFVSWSAIISILFKYVLKTK